MKIEVEVNVDVEEPQMAQSPSGMLSKYAWLVRIDF